MRAHETRWFVLASALSLAVSACATAPAPTPQTPAEPEAAEVAEPAIPPPPPKQAPPDSGPMRDVNFPPRETFTLDNGLTVDVVHQPQLPIVEMQLVVTSGRAQDPKNKPGVAAMVAEMLTQGTRTMSAAQFAEAIEFLGARLDVHEEADAVRLSMRALSEHLDQALNLLSDAATRPAFRPDELNKLRRRELGRLKLQQQEADYLAYREFNRVVYGDHPYAEVDTTEAVLKKLSRADLVRWHGQHFVASNAFLVVVGDVTAEQMKAALKKNLARWKQGKVAEPEYPEVAAREQLEVLVVDRPESVQSVIYIGAPGVKRSADDWVQLRVANQVLGGSAASRLFMDLREKRSLTYGAYSQFSEREDVGTFRANASVRNAVTQEAVDAFMQHLHAIVEEPIPQAELEAAHRYLADSFPLKIETAARVADLIADLRLYDLPADYWDTLRTRIRAVSAAQAHEAAEQHIDPDKVLVLVVGKAAEIVPGLRHLGPVRVIDTEGKPVTAFEQDAADAAKSGEGDGTVEAAGGQPEAKPAEKKAAAKPKPKKPQGN